MSCWSELYIPNTTYEWCDGAESWQALPVTVKGIIYTKKCPTDVEYDFEKLVLCEKTTGNKVLVESRTNTNDPLQARTTRYTYLATNLPFAWNPDTDLEDCANGEKLDIQTKQYCDSWETVRGTLVWEVTSLTPNLLWIVFNKIDWTVHTPVAPVEWACVAVVANRQVDVLEDCDLNTTATDVNWNVAQEVILSGSTKTIPVRIIEDCAIQQVVPVPNCDWTTTNQNVDEITATYLLNQQNKHTEIMYDVVGAWLSWSVLFWYTAPKNVWVDYSGVTITWDAILSYWTDFGDWYNDVWWSPSHSYNADGSYEIKGYAITASGNKLLLFAQEVNITSWTIIYWGANPQPVNRTYNILSSAVLQDYCNNTPVYTYKSNWWAYTTVWTLFVVKPDIIDELEDNADYQASISSPTNTVQTSTVLQLDAFWTIVWQVLRLDRVYDNTGALVSETYYDTVTWLPILLNPLTAQIIDAHWLDTEIIELCDDNWTFLRHIWHAPWWQPMSQRDTTIDWTTSYTTSWVVHKCEKLEIREKEVCGFVDWSTSSYQLIRLYTRDSITWAMTIIGYEDVFWNAVTWAVVETCCDFSAICYGSVVAPISNRRSDSYWAFTAQYKTWIDDGKYDNVYVWRWPVGSPRNHYYRVKVYNDSNTLLSTTVLWPYAVDPSNATYLQFLSDLSSLTAPVWVSFVWTTPSLWRWWYQIEYNNTIGFSITFEHWIDNHAWWILRNPEIKQAIRYETSWAEVRDSIVTSWDFNNPALDAWWREWTGLPIQNINVVII